MGEILKKYYGYAENVTTIKKYGDNFLRVQTMNRQRLPCTEHQDSDFIHNEDLKRQLHIVDSVDDIPTLNEEYNKFLERHFQSNQNNEFIKKEKDNNVRLEESIIRTRRNVFEYAMSNEWQYFCTFTIDKNKYDRYNLNEYHKAFSQWLRDYFRKKLGFDVQYILIPEEHEDGAWHEHGLFTNFPLSELVEFKTTDNIPRKLKKRIEEGHKMYNCPAYAKKFGYCTFELVRNSEACAKYVTKYITKDIVNSSIETGHKLYYVSRKLKKAENIAVGTYQGVPFYDFENEYCRMATFAYSEDFAKLLESKIEKM